MDERHGFVRQYECPASRFSLCGVRMATKNVIDIMLWQLYSALVLSRALIPGEAIRLWKKRGRESISVRWHWPIAFAICQ